MTCSKLFLRTNRHSHDVENKKNLHKSCYITTKFTSSYDYIELSMAKEYPTPYVYPFWDFLKFYIKYLCKSTINLIAASIHEYFDGKCSWKYNFVRHLTDCYIGKSITQIDSNMYIMRTNFLC